MEVVDTIGPPLVAFLLASLIAFLDVLTKRFPRTYFLLISPRRCLAIWIYAISYGVIAAILTIIVKGLIAQNILHLEGLWLDKAWVRAIYVGLFTKTFLQFDLFKIGEARVGFAQITAIFEPPLIRSIELTEDHLVKSYLRPYIDKYPINDEARKRIIEDIPAILPEEERKAFELDIKLKVESGPEAMRLVLRKLGPTAINRIFPLKDINTPSP